MDHKQTELVSLQQLSTAENFWDDNQAAQQCLKAMSELQDSINEYEMILIQAKELQELLQLAEEEQEKELYQETVKELERFSLRFEEYELQLLFAGEYDHADAIVSMHAGAGGTEAQDWVEMLLRMYSRWADNSGYKVEILDFLGGDEAGVKSVTLLISGRYAYGKMKCEEGVHRLIRISPFDSSGRRHTSFASVSVLPEISDEVQININPDDLRIDTYRSGGAGGQHVNKTDSAVRITHLPTGIVVQCQNERSQHSNKATAMKLLQARLLEVRAAEMQADRQKLKGEQREIAWGSQIRTYTMNPFSLVKDHRSGLEMGNVQAVMDGDIDSFINSFLRMNIT